MLLVRVPLLNRVYRQHQLFKKGATFTMKRSSPSKRKNLTRKVKNKKGATLIELLAVVCILGIVVTLSFSAVFSAVVQVKKCAEISSAQKASALVQYYITVYGKAADQVKSFDAELLYEEYDEVLDKGFQDHESNPTEHPFNDLFFRIDDKSQFSISRFVMNAGLSHGTETLLTLEGIESIDFRCTNISGANKYVLNYTVITSSGYILDGGVVMNNVRLGMGVRSSIKLSASESINTLNIRTASRTDIDRT